jgi:hypothetical protein
MSELAFKVPKWDASRAVKQPNGGSIAPRVDIEAIFVAVSVNGTLIGQLQRFEDGTYGYWNWPGDQAKLAPSIDEAYARVCRLETATSHVIVCPRCNAPFRLAESEAERKADDAAMFSGGAIPLKCKSCGAQISTK